MVHGTRQHGELGVPWHGSWFVVHGLIQGSTAWGAAVWFASGALQSPRCARLTEHPMLLCELGQFEMLLQRHHRRLGYQHVDPLLDSVPGPRVFQQRTQLCELWCKKGKSDVIFGCVV
jgi:hypothetical protein